MKNIISIFLLMCAMALALNGCGETISGAGKDVNRMGRGASTFFFRQ